MKTMMMMDALFTTSGSHKRFPLPGAPKMSWVDTITYGVVGPLWFGKGEDHVAQRAEAMKQHDGGDTGGFYPGSGR
jgi:hypothetical protein